MRISLVIPTRERCALLEHSLATALAVPDPDLEIVVSDNASTDGTRDMLVGISDPRLKLVGPPRRVSMRENFETGLAAATGDYVIFIGDDDGVTRQGMATLRNLLEKHRPDAVNWDLVHYLWPSAHVGHGCGVLRIKPRCAYGRLERRPPRRLLQQLCAGRLRNYKETANIYHGCISRGLIERVRGANGGTYFGGAIPDVYSGIANLVHMQRDFLWVGHPVTFGGASDRSNGSAQMARVRVPDAGGEENRRFGSEAAGDAGAAGVDIGIPSLDALTLDMLRLVDRHHADGRLPIDYGAWMDRIVRRLSRAPRDIWERAQSALIPYVEVIGQKNAFDEACARHPFRGPETVPEAGRPTRSKVNGTVILLADAKALASALDAAQAIDTIVATPHRPGGILSAPLHWGRWAGAVRRADRLSAEWGQRKPAVT